MYSKFVTVFKVIRPPVLIQLTSFYTQDLLLSYIQPSSPGSPHSSVVPTHKSLHQFHIASFHYYTNILCLSRDPSRVPYSLGSSTVGSYSTLGLVMSPCFVFVLSFQCRKWQMVNSSSKRPIMFKDKIKKNGNRVNLDHVYQQLHRGSYKLISEEERVLWISTSPLARRLQTLSTCYEYLYTFFIPSF
jgi:hypothetical protein